MQLDEFLTHLDGVKPTGKDKYMACCPVHGDETPSLSVAVKDVKGTRKILLKCFAGCRTEDIVRELGLSMQDLIVNPTAKQDFQKSRGQKKLVARYDYLDREGRFLFQKTRWQWEDGKKD